jgi:hypothetical protein
MMIAGKADENVGGTVASAFFLYTMDSSGFEPGVQ